MEARKSCFRLKGMALIRDESLYSSTGDCDGLSLPTPILWSLLCTRWAETPMEPNTAQLSDVDAVDAGLMASRPLLPSHETSSCLTTQPHRDADAAHACTLADESQSPLAPLAVPTISLPPPKETYQYKVRGDFCCTHDECY